MNIIYELYYRNNSFVIVSKTQSEGYSSSHDHSTYLNLEDALREMSYLNTNPQGIKIL